MVQLISSVIAFLTELIRRTGALFLFLGFLLIVFPKIPGASITNDPFWTISSSLMGYGLICGGAFFSWRERDKITFQSELRARNIFRIPSENPKRDIRMEKIFSEHTTSMLLMARTGHSFLHHGGRNWNYPSGVGVKHKLEGGIPLKVILEDPYSENAFCRHRADGGTSPFFDVSWGLLEQRIKEYPNLEIYFTSAPMTCSLFFTDKRVFYDPYHFGKFPKANVTKNQFFVMEFESSYSSGKSTSYELLKHHFEFVKNDKLTTITFDQFREKYAERLKREVG
jgi:hypothetical protein